MAAPPGVRGADADEEPWDVRAARERLALYREQAPQRRCTARIPERWHDVGFDDFDADGRAVAITAAREWAEGHGVRGLLLYGDVGMGKTRIAGAAAWLRCEIGPVRWLNVAELLLDLSRPFDAPERRRAIEALSPSSNVALVLDDLDKARATDYAVQPLYLAVNACVEARRPLFVTMNRSVDALADDFGDRFGAAIGSRLGGYCEEHEIGGRDRRLEP